MEEVVRVNCGNIELVATIHTCEERSNKLVFLLHGGPEGSRDGPNDLFKKLAERLAEIGLDSVRFDFMGQGESTGDYVDMTMESQRQDLYSIHRHFSKDYNDIVLVGESFGATCVLGCLDLNPSAIVLLWPAIYLMDVCYAPFFDEPYKSELRERGYITVGHDRVGKRFLDEVIAVNNFESNVREIGVPTLFIHGKADREVPYTASVRAHEIVSSRKRIVLVEGADHCLRRPEEQQTVLMEVCEWLK